MYQCISVYISVYQCLSVCIIVYRCRPAPIGVDKDRIRTGVSLDFRIQTLGLWLLICEYVGDMRICRGFVVCLHV